MKIKLIFKTGHLRSNFLLFADDAADVRVFVNGCPYVGAFAIGQLDAVRHRAWVAKMQGPRLKLSKAKGTAHDKNNIVDDTSHDMMYELQLKLY